MSFFAVQVHVGSEIQVKKMLQDVLSRTANQAIKAIYALESYTLTINEKTNLLNLKEISSADINNHLYTQRLQTNLSNLRAAYDQLENYKDNSSVELMQEYRKQIKSIASKIKNIRDTTKKISSVLKGYILVEVQENFDYLPNHLWHLIKCIPKVTGFPSRMNIPQEEVDGFFEEIDMSSEVEMQFDEVLTFEQEKMQEDKSVEQLNETTDKEEQAEINKQLDDMYTDIEDEVQQTKSAYPNMINRVKALIKNQRKTVKIPVTLLQQLCQAVMKKGSIQPQMKSSSEFIHRLRQWLQQNQAVLE